MLATVERALAERMAAAKAARVDGVPTADEFLDALHQLERRKEFGKHHKAMLAALHKASERSLTAGELAEAPGWNSYGPANAHLGSFARELSLELGYQPVKADSRDPSAWTYTLATAAPDRSSEDHFRWRMRPEFAEAFERFQNGGSASGRPSPTRTR
ncbi:hypothetical protein [Belnapia sp. F-4-1]|uniref:hypothetical protein n=1 Tax=Belnapia sp. F-4-1 TaxID=1545443 RepID=UPI0011869CE0|nr:hypothetical protein [Belnapia sp. F-4-1]